MVFLYWISLQCFSCVLVAMAMMAAQSMDHLNSLGARLDFSQFNALPMMAAAAPGLKNTLLDEGLRIATQYGMVDFAAELQVLRKDPVSESEKKSYHEAHQKTVAEAALNCRVNSSPLGCHMVTSAAVSSNMNSPLNCHVSNTSVDSAVTNGTHVKCKPDPDVPLNCHVNATSLNGEGSSKKVDSNANTELSVQSETEAASPTPSRDENSQSHCGENSSGLEPGEWNPDAEHSSDSQMSSGSGSSRRKKSTWKMSSWIAAEGNWTFLQCTHPTETWCHNDNNDIMSE